MSKRPPTRLALGVALAVGGLVGSGVTFAALRSGRTPTSAPTTAVAPSDVGPRVAEVLSEEDSLQRVTELSALLSTLQPSAAPAVSQAFKAARIGVGDPEQVLLATWWARFDPEAALAWISAQGSVGSGTAIAAIFRTWAHTDPQLAIGTARMLAVQMQGDLAVDAAIVGWDESRKPGLIELLATLP